MPQKEKDGRRPALRTTGATSSMEKTSRFDAHAAALLDRIRKTVVQTDMSDAERMHNIESIRDDLARWKDEASTVVVAFAEVVQQRWDDWSGPRWREFFRDAKAEEGRPGNKNERLRRMHLAGIMMYWPSKCIADYEWDHLADSKMQRIYQCAEKRYPWSRWTPPARLVLMLRHSLAVTNGRSEPLPPSERRPDLPSKTILGPRLDITIKDLKAIRSLSDEPQNVYGTSITIASAAEYAEEIKMWTTDMDGSIRVRGYPLRDWRPRDWPLFLLELDDHGLLRQRREGDRPALTPPHLGMVSPPPSTLRARTTIDQQSSPAPIVHRSPSAAIAVDSNAFGDDVREEDVESVSGALSVGLSEVSTAIGSPSPKTVFDVVALSSHRRAFSESNSADEISLGSTPVAPQSRSAMVFDDVWRDEPMIGSPREAPADARHGSWETTTEVGDHSNGGADEAGTSLAADREEPSVGAAEEDHDSGEAAASGGAQPAAIREVVPPCDDTCPSTAMETAAAPNALENVTPIRTRSEPRAVAEPAGGGEDMEDAGSSTDWTDGAGEESDVASGDDSPGSDSDGYGGTSTVPQSRFRSFSPHTPSRSSHDLPGDLHDHERLPTLHRPIHAPSGTPMSEMSPIGDRYDSEDDDDGRSGASPTHSILDSFDGGSDWSDRFPTIPGMTPGSITPYTPAAPWEDWASDSECSLASLPTPPFVRRSTRPWDRDPIGGTSLRMSRPACRPSIGDRGAWIPGASLALQQALSQASGCHAPIAAPESGGLFVSPGTEEAVSYSALGSHPTSLVPSGHDLSVDGNQPIPAGEYPWAAPAVTAGPNRSPSDDHRVVASASARGSAHVTVSSGAEREPGSLHQPSDAELERYLQNVRSAALQPHAIDVCMDRWHWLSEARPASTWSSTSAALAASHAEPPLDAEADISVLSCTAFMAAAKEGVVFTQPVLIEGSLADGDVHTRESLARGLRDRFGTTPAEIRRMRNPSAETMRMSDLVDLLSSDEDAATSLGLRDRVRAQMPAMTYLHRFDLLDVALARGSACPLPAGLHRAHRIPDVRPLTVDHIDTTGAFRGPQIPGMGGTCIRVLEGTMLCIYVPRTVMGEEEWEAFGRDGSSWRPHAGVRRVMLKRNEQLFLPAGTVSAAYAMEACVSKEVPVWDRHDLLHTLRGALWALQHPQCATGASIREVPWVADVVESLVRDVGHFAESARQEEWWTPVAETMRALRRVMNPRDGPGGGMPQRRTASSPPSVGTSHTQHSARHDKRPRLC